jgi:hypothetical protein
MSIHRLNLELPSKEYTCLKMLCAKKGITIEDFVTSLILQAIEEEEDSLLIRKAQQRLGNLNPDELIPIDQAFKEAGWDV